MRKKIIDYLSIIGGGSFLLLFYGFDLLSFSLFILFGIIWNILLLNAIIRDVIKVIARKNRKP